MNAKEALQKSSDEIIEEQKPDVICLGYDQNSYSENLDIKLNERGIKAEIIRLSSHMEHKYKSSNLRPS